MTVHIGYEPIKIVFMYDLISNMHSVWGFQVNAFPYAADTGRGCPSSWWPGQCLHGTEKHGAILWAERRHLALRPLLSQMSGDWQNGKMEPNSLSSKVLNSILILLVQVQGDNGYKEGEAHCHVGLALENRGDLLHVKYWTINAVVNVSISPCCLSLST